MATRVVVMMMMMILLFFFLVLAPCRLVSRWQHFEETY
jgi:hypothetical protein